MDKNDQYGNAMTKPFPTGSIKRMKKNTKSQGIQSNHPGNF